jgi:hypothetical protein
MSTHILPLVSSLVAGVSEKESQILFWDGYIAFLEEHTLDELVTDRQRAGWELAHKHVSDSDVYSIEDDQEFIRTGGA